MRYFDFERGRPIGISEILGKNTENEIYDDKKVVRTPENNCNGSNNIPESRDHIVEGMVVGIDSLNKRNQNGGTESVSPGIATPAETASVSGISSGFVSKPNEQQQHRSTTSLSDINCDRSIDLEEFKIKILDIQQMSTSQTFYDCIQTDIIPFLQNANDAMMYLTEADKIVADADEEPSILIHSRASNCLTEILKYRGRIEQKLPLSLSDENHDIRWIMLAALKAFRRFCVEMEVNF